MKISQTINKLFWQARKHANKAAFFVFLLFLMTACYFGYYYGPATFVPQRPGNFIIGLKDTKQDIIKKLVDGKFIKNEKIFLELLELKQKNIVNPGGFFISPSMWPYQIINILSSQSNQIWFTIEPGERREQIALELKKKLKWNKNETQKFIEESKEGFLFPETYLLDVDSKPKEIIDKFENELKKQIKDLNISDKDLNRIMTFASLVERESVAKVDSRLVAGILQNRLNQNQFLQIDATVQYALGSELAWWPRITRQDYQIDHPYNTYKIKGLPPGPICATGLDAIKSVLNPEKTNYMFYLHDRNMIIHPAYTYQQHQQNMATYIGN